MSTDRTATRTAPAPPAPPAPPTAGPGATGRRALHLGAGVVLLALNLRPALVAVSPLAGTIRDDSGMSAAATSLLTALPLLCFGLLAPVAPRLGRRFGMERSLLGTMALICLGTALRLLDPVVALFAGTVVIGAGIAVANVLLPGLIKRDFPARAGLMTGLYSMSLFGGAALAAGVTVPVQHAAGLNWQATLACWGRSRSSPCSAGCRRCAAVRGCRRPRPGRPPVRCAACGVPRWPGR
ncbi:MFS transporter [Streptomyces sp. NPDC001657]|uniref:MFS transporter n=1 Tax=Streptomyces sp. NPDC001657 TaxID=3154522 RepID=UPI00332F4A61